MTDNWPKRPGRPRHIPQPKNQGLSPHDQVLDAAAFLFADQGFAKTSTREIAERVGIRQASIYYHFPNGKDDILTEVVSKSIRPTLDMVETVENLTEDPDTALYLLAMIDVRTLADAPHNTGLLGMLPDVADKVPEFAVERKELGAAYQRIGERAASKEVVISTSGRLGALILVTVENVINWIKDGDYKRDRSPDVIAASCLRVCGLDELAINEAAGAARVLLPQFEEEREQ